jgi:hypothetical protein
LRGGGRPGPPPPRPHTAEARRCKFGGGTPGPRSNFQWRHWSPRLRVRELGRPGPPSRARAAHAGRGAAMWLSQGPEGARLFLGRAVAAALRAGAAELRAGRPPEVGWRPYGEQVLEGRPKRGGAVFSWPVGKDSRAEPSPRSSQHCCREDRWEQGRCVPQRLARRGDAVRARSHHLRGERFGGAAR